MVKTAGPPSLLSILLLLPLLLLPLTGAAQQGDARTYVRRIEFDGATSIQDDVLRREMLQLEAAFLNTVALEESRRRLERLFYVDSAEVRLRPVEGTSNVVDVVITIVEAPSRRYGGGGGYSESQGTSLHAYFIDENLAGTGQRFSFVFDGSELRGMTEIAHTDPYARASGVSRTVALSARRVDQLTRDTSSLDAELASASIEYGIPLRGGAGSTTLPLPRRAANRWPGSRLMQPWLEPDSALRVGLDLRAVDLTAAPGASGQLLSWIAALGGSGSIGSTPAVDYTELDLLLGWRFDSRDRSIFPSTGLEQTLSFRGALPGSDVEYFAIDYDVAKYWQLGEDWTASLRGTLGFGAEYAGDLPSLPPYLNWFAGGPSTVRGYRESGLGPRDSLGNPYGGNLLVAAQAELMTPWPSLWRERIRAGFFYDAGNVFSTEDTMFADDAGRPLSYRFDASELRRSVGVAVHVLIPLGMLRLSYAVPLNAEEDEPGAPFRDDVERFQISIGVDF